MKTGQLPTEVALFDLDPQQASLMAALGRAAAPDSPTRLRIASTPDDAIADGDFVICSIRPGGMAARARDERIALDLGYTGQETIGPAGCAMAWRTIPAVLAYAQMMERLAPKAWLINFTNPAGLVTQAISEASSIRAVGICDTPAELFFRIALSFGVELQDVNCEYLGLNHLGFVRKVEIRGEDRTQDLLADDERLRSLYPAPLFPPQLIRQIGLIPTEYAFFYYRPGLSRTNQLRVGKTRGEELMEMNSGFYAAVSEAAEKDGATAGLRVYVRYLNLRNASYLQLEGGGTSAFARESPDWDPFQAVTGYHRIAVDTIQGLCGARPTSLVLNIANGKALGGLKENDVVELNCKLDRSGINPIAQQDVPYSVLGLIESTKAYERCLVRAAIERDDDRITWAFTQHPLIRDWDSASTLVRALLNDV
jgi:6-phospho-beta-glucosidase